MLLIFVLLDSLYREKFYKRKEAKRARDDVSNDEDDKTDNDEAKDSFDSELDNKKANELASLCQEMEALECRRYFEETATAMFTQAITQAQLAGQVFGDEVDASLAAIFEGSNNQDPCAVAA